jgi:opacity protein-like surface antigen
MREIRLLAACMFISLFSFSQRVHIGVFGGLSAYEGDLVDKFFPKKVTNGAIGITGNYELNDKLMLRAGFLYTVVGGADRNSNDTVLQHRNLSFETSIKEFSLLAEYYLFNLNEQRYSPYIFGGLAVFHFNPYAYPGGSTQRVYLKPLSTEGEGLAAYPTHKQYKLTQLAIPLGGGIKYAVTDNLRIGLELGLRKLFTDYLDDVSTSYVAQSDLLAAKGPMAVDLAYRGDEVANGNPNYPAKDAQRGGAKLKDWYYTFGFHVTYRLGANSNGSHPMFGRKKGYGCPGSPL